MIALQLYTVRDLLTDAESTRATLLRIKEIGYEGVQLAGAVSEVRAVAQMADEVGLRVIGFLGGVTDIENASEELFSALRAYGATDIGISGYQTTEHGAREFAARVNAAAKKVRDAGFTFSYHNHHHEFLRTACGKTVMDIYKEVFDPSLVDFMPDTYWLQRAGIDVRDFIETKASRITILHLKDYECREETALFAPLGEGNLNLRGIVSLAERVGIRDLVVEQDVCEGDPLACVARSYAYLTQILAH